MEYIAKYAALGLITGTRLALMALAYVVGLATKALDWAIERLGEYQDRVRAKLR